MRMPSLRQSIPQDIITSDVQTLAAWLDGIKHLIKLHGNDMVLYFETNTFVLFRISKSIIPYYVEQRYIEDNTEMTLKQWRETLENLISQFNEDYYVHLVSNSGFNIRLSAIA